MATAPTGTWEQQRAALRAQGARNAKPVTAPVTPIRPTTPVKANLPSTYTPPDSVPATNIGTPALKTAEPNVPTASSGVTAVVSAYAKSVRDMNAQRASEAQKEMSKGRSTMSTLVSRLRGINQEKAALYESEGVNQLKMETDEITSRMEAKDLAARRKIEKIQDNREGLFGGAVNDEVTRIERENAREQADLAIVLTAKNRAYDTARSIIDEAVKAETEDLKFQYEDAKFFFAENQKAFTKAEERQYQSILDDYEREYKDAQDTRTQVRELQFKAAENGAPSTTVSDIGSSTSIEEAMAKAGRFIQNVDTQVVEVNGRKVLINSSTGATVRDLGYSGDGSSGSGGGPVNLTADNKRELLGVGLLPSHITEIQADVNQYGLPAVLEDPTLTAAQKATLKKVYGGATAGVTLDRAALSQFYGIPDDDKKTLNLNKQDFWTKGQLYKSNKTRLDEIEREINRYRAIGYTDDEIMKLLQKEK